MVHWRAVGKPSFRMRLTMLPSGRSQRGSRPRSVRWQRQKTRAVRQDTACPSTVARAAPATPQRNTATKRMSSTTLRLTETMMQYRGMRELPTPRRVADMAL